MDKKKADQQASPKKSRLNDTSAAGQHARLLAHLREHGSVDTITARRELNIMHPAARIQELRELGHAIKSHPTTLTDDHGRQHRGVATYYLTTSE